jgi:hypothetical protein
VNVSTIETGNDADVPALFDQPDGVDWLLAHIVELADIGLEMSISVCAEGVLLSGTLIGGRTYFEELSATVLSTASANPDQKAVIDLLGSGFAKFKDVYPEKEAGINASNRPAFLHLRGATPILNTETVKGNGALFRVQLAKVSAFSLSATTYMPGRKFKFRANLVRLVSPEVAGSSSVSRAIESMAYQATHFSKSFTDCGAATLLLVATALPVLARPTLTQSPSVAASRRLKRQPDPDGGFVTNF